MPKILLIGPDYFNYTTSVAQALTLMGHTVKTIAYEYNLGEFHYFKKKITKLGIKYFENKFFELWNKDAVKEIEQFKPDLCLVLNGYVLSENTLAACRSKGIKTILWMIDSIKRMPILESHLSFYDHIWSFEPDDEAYIRQKYNLRCLYSPVGYDPLLYYPDIEIDKDIDISFIGSRTKNRIAILQQVAQYAEKYNKKFEVFGIYWPKKYVWKQYIDKRKYRPLDQFVNNHLIDPKEVATIYRRSKICLNIHIPEHDGVNPRTFEILGTNSFELTDIKSNLVSILKPGKHIVGYRSSSELLEFIDYYLHQENKRQEIAQSGYEYVSQHYTMEQVLKNILINVI